MQSAVLEEGYIIPEHHDLISRDQFLVQLAKWKETGDIAARNAIVNANIGLIIDIADKLSKKFKLDFDDAVGDGTLGIMTAIEKFDPKENTEFSTYATYWIKQAIRRAHENKGRTVRVSSNTQNMIRHFKRAEQELLNELGGVPNVEEIAERLIKTWPTHAWSIAKANDIKGLTLSGHSIPLDAPSNTFQESESQLIHSLAAPAVEEDPLEDEKRRLTEAIGKLDDRRREVIMSRYFENQTLEVIGDRLGVTKERIRQIEDDALRQLQNRFGMVLPPKKIVLLASSEVGRELEAKIKAARKKGMSFEELEEAFHLRGSCGKCAWRVCMRGVKRTPKKRKSRTLNQEKKNDPRKSDPKHVGPRSSIKRRGSFSPRRGTDLKRNQRGIGRRAVRQH